MNRNGGWVKLISLEGGRVLGRGQLRLRERPPLEGRPSWVGQLGSLRLDSTSDLPAPGHYRLWFEGMADEQEIRVDRLDMTAPAPSAQVSCVGDCELPLSVTRLGGA